VFRVLGSNAHANADVVFAPGGKLALGLEGFKAIAARFFGRVRGGKGVKVWTATICGGIMDPSQVCVRNGLWRTHGAARVYRQTSRTELLQFSGLPRSPNRSPAQFQEIQPSFKFT